MNSTGYEKCIPILQMLVTALLLWLQGKQSQGSHGCLCSDDNIQQLLSTYANIPNLTFQLLGNKKEMHTRREGAIEPHL